AAAHDFQAGNEDQSFLEMVVLCDYYKVVGKVHDDNDGLVTVSRHALDMTCFVVS
nr:hypothetical protein [Tanacetum cinerariifolium]